MSNLPGLMFPDGGGVMSVRQMTAAQLATYVGKVGEIVEIIDVAGRPQYRWDGSAMVTSGGGSSAWADVTGKPAGLAVFDLATYATVSGSYYAGWQTAMAALDAAGGGIIQVPEGVCDITGALQDVGRSNAQLLLPSRHVLNGEQITVVIRGVRPPPTAFSVIGDYPVPDNHSVLRSTLTAGSGGALLGGWGPSGSYSDFTGVHVIIEDVTFRMPSNPTHSAVDLSHVNGCAIDDVVIDTGSYWIQGLTQPTTATSYGIKFPQNGNGADVRVGCLNVCGFYTGSQHSEHLNAEQLNFWGCLRALEPTFAHHASHIKRLMTVHCTNGIVPTGIHYLDIEQFNIEHSTTGWWIPNYDIDDPANRLRGRLKWHVVKAGSGVDSTFLTNGGDGMDWSQVGTPSAPKGRVISASKTLDIFDAGKLLQTGAPGAIVLTVPPDSSVFFDSMTEIHVRQIDVGSVTIAAGAGVTIQKPASQSMAIKEQFGVVTLKKLGANAWALFGMLG